MKEKFKCEIKKGKRDIRKIESTASSENIILKKKMKPELI